MFYQTSQVSLPTPASGTRNPEGGYPPEEKKFSVTSRMGPVFISLSIGSKLPLTTEMKTRAGKSEIRKIQDIRRIFGGYPPNIRIFPDIRRISSGYPADIRQISVAFHAADNRPPDDCRFPRQYFQPYTE